MKSRTRLAMAVLGLAVALQSDAYGRSGLNQPIPDSVIVRKGGCEWVWASPCSGRCSQVRLRDGFRFATPSEFANRPSYSDFLDSRGQPICAARWFDPRFDHCDATDFRRGFVTSRPNNNNWETLLIRKPVNSQPVVVCPSNATVECTQAPAGANVTLKVTVSDNDGDNLSVTWTIDGQDVATDNVANGTKTTLTRTFTFPLGVSSLCITVKDGTTAPVECKSSVSVVDTTPPVATCAADVTVANDPGECFASNVKLTPPRVSENCEVASITNDAPTTFDVGTTEITWTITDVGGNKATCTQNVIVIDNERPVVSCNSPSSITPPDAPISFTGSATDNCQVASVAIEDVKCFAINGANKVIDKSESCVVSVDGATITISDSGGVGTFICWTVVGTDIHGNVTRHACIVQVINPGKKKGNGGSPTSMD